MFLTRYTRWLHTGWPAGTVEQLPDRDDHGRTTIPGVRIAGDLSGIPLLKFAADSGARAVQEIITETGLQAATSPDNVLDLAIVGGGVAGIAAALEARKHNLRFTVFEATQPFATIAGFPKGKPIYTYPTGMTPTGELKLQADIKEDLLAELEDQRTAAGIEPVPLHVHRIGRRDGLLTLEDTDGQAAAIARRVIVAIGRSGNYRMLNIPGEDLPKTYNRLHDPKDFCDSEVIVIGGGDSAVEAAIALADCGAHVTLSCRGTELTRPKPENVEQLHETAGRTGNLQLKLGTEPTAISADSVTVKDRTTGTEETLPNDVVFTMIGREAPLDFFRRSGLKVRGDWTARMIAAFTAFMLFAAWLYTWKSGGAVTAFFQERAWFPFNVPDLFAAIGGTIARQAADPTQFLGTLRISLTEPGFYYSLAYTLAVLVFGIRRIRRRNTPYITRQTITLAAFQLIPLFLLPYIVLPWLGHNGFFESGFARTAADHLFPLADYGHGREYWRAFGFILAWPLFIWNAFSGEPLTWWLVIGFVQTFVIIPVIVWRWGKGAYCGWVCSCGALAETLGDTHREKMPHGPLWNRLNMTGQIILAAAVLLMIGRAVSWIWPGTGIGRAAFTLYNGLLSNWSVLGIQLNYYHIVDITLAGIIGVGFYFWFSGRVWCRFACPLAALMHIYARFSRFRIFPDKKKCISCNVCTSVCHQGIDIMSFANRGLPMEDPECVRCSACVQSCPTGVLTFGRQGSDGEPIFDLLQASQVQASASS